MTELGTGTQLGNCELLTELGRGGMASVWVARQHASEGQPERLVAVKVMLPELARSTEFREMFLEEGRIVQSIHHENVVQVFEVAESQSLLYMAMEWVEGDSLRTVIKEARQRRPIPPEMAVRIMADTAAGLQAAHEIRDWDGALRGIVHCDISPHNILIGPRGKAKLVDFGVAQAASRTALGAGKQIQGKFGYMSPEQARGGKFDLRSDLFSMGVVLFELTTGERLFRGEDAAGTLRKVASAPIPRPSSVIPDYPAPLEEIVMRALAREPNQRFQSAMELRQALDQFLIDQRIMVSHAGVGQLAKKVLGPRIQKRRQAIKTALSTLDHLGDTEASSWRASQLSQLSQVSQFTGTFDSQAALHPVPTEVDGPHGHKNFMGYLVAAALLVTAGLISAVLLLRQAPGASLQNRIIKAGAMPEASAQHSAPRRLPPPPSEPEGTDVESLPTETVPIKPHR